MNYVKVGSLPVQPSACSVCGAAFSDTWDMKIDVVPLQGQGQKMVADYRCDICGAVERMNIDLVEGRITNETFRS